ncbi:MAG TPA: FG-GAP-like repeat-containing protein, partial [Flavitalea sp.]|nr:FG-GAP-like repeat-containing protein [Flavitalea sp.]
DNAWLRVTFKGADGNRNGFGAKVWIWQDHAMQFNYYSPYRGYLSTVEPFIHFGVGNKKIDSVKILWPDGSMQIIKNIQSKQTLILNIKDAVKDSTTAAPAALHQLFTSIGDSVNIHYKHEEDDFVDFKVQPILPRMHSREGPSIAVGDINGDGLEDFYTGAATGQHANIFLQQKNGSFKQNAFADSNRADNMGALLFDADNDGDLDLYVAAGGSSIQKKQSNVYRHSLYSNDGKGNYTAVSTGLPSIITPGSNVTGADYDRDGDIDLFVAGRISSGEYPYSPQSFVLRNDSKKGLCHFTDVTNEINPDLSAPGMITASLWSDFNNDGWVDLILAGEFMPLRFFKNENGKLKEVTAAAGLSNTGGWWNSITGADYDKDGDIDYVLGNLGLNTPYTASADQPVCIYASDYDKNGRIDPVMCHFVSGKEYIVHARDDMSKQITSMRARFRTYEKYASVTFREAFRQDEIKEAFIVKAERFENSYLENKGNGKFQIHALPLRAQLSPINGMISGDFNGDGNMDIAGVGNSFSTEVQTGRYDARGSILLLGDSKGKFTVSNAPFVDNCDSKSISRIQLQNGDASVIVGSNSDSLKMYRINSPTNSVALHPDEYYAIITDQNNKEYRQEFYYGHTFLSQESRRFSVPSGTKMVSIYSYQGNKRSLKF